MDIILLEEEVVSLGASPDKATTLINHIKATVAAGMRAEQRWQALANYLTTQHYPFPIHLLVFNTLYPKWQDHLDLAPAWIPTLAHLSRANITQFMASLKMTEVSVFHPWTSEHV